MTDLSYETIARAVEGSDAVNPPPPPTPTLGPGEAQTRGPVIITPRGEVRDARTNETLIAPPETDTGREIDLSLIGFVLWAAASLLGVVAASIAPLTASQRLALIALVVLVAAERLWMEIRRLTKPQEVYHVGSFDPPQGIDDGLYGRPGGDRPSRGT